MASVNFFTEDRLFQYRLLHPSVKFFWLGFETTGYILHKQGWELRIDRYDFQKQLRIYGKHKGGRNWGEGCEFVTDYFDAENLAKTHDYQEYVIQREFAICMHLAGSIKFNITGDIPCTITTDLVKFGELRNIEGNMCEYILFDNDSIIIEPEPSILELLENIKEKQKPNVQDILHKRMRYNKRILIPED